MLLYRPLLVLLFVPIVAQKMLNDRYVCWGIESYYMIEVVSILTIAVFWALSEVKNRKIMQRLAWIIMISTTVVTLVKLKDRALPWYDSKRECFFS